VCHVSVSKKDVVSSLGNSILNYKNNFLSNNHNKGIAKENILSVDQTTKIIFSVLFKYLSGWAPSIFCFVFVAVNLVRSLRCICFCIHDKVQINLKKKNVKNPTILSVLNNLLLVLVVCLSPVTVSHRLWLMPSVCAVLQSDSNYRMGTEWAYFKGK